MTRLQNNLRFPVRYGSRDKGDEDARLPKTMGHWFSEFGVRFDPLSGTGYGVRRDLKLGCGSPIRYFRALPHLGVLQICDGYFDRWANSVGAETSLPKNRVEFVAAMKFLLASAELAKIDAEAEIVSLEEELSSVDQEISELRNDNLDLEAHVHYFGLSERWIKKLWKYYQRRLASLGDKRRRIAGDLKFQRMREQQG